MAVAGRGSSSKGLVAEDAGLRLLGRCKTEGRSILKQKVIEWHTKKGLRLLRPGLMSPTGEVGALQIEGDTALSRHSVTVQLLCNSGMCMRHLLGAGLHSWVVVSAAWLSSLPISSAVSRPQ